MDGDGPCNTDCSRVEPGYRCSGLVGEDCSDIDECKQEVCGKHAECFNVPAGNFTCSCNAGYTGGGVGVRLNCRLVNNNDPAAQAADLQEVFSGTLFPIVVVITVAVVVLSGVGVVAVAVAAAAMLLLF